MAKSEGRTPAHIAAREKVSRDYLESNGFTDSQIEDALGDVKTGSKGGVDLAKPVKVKSFPPPNTMYQHVRSNGRPGNWFDPIGKQSPDVLGISGEGRNVAEFKVPRGTGLQSRARPVVDTWTNPQNPVSTQGGGVQLFVNNTVRNNVVGI